MIQHPGFPVEPWAVRETGIDMSVLAQSESVLALGNGHLGLRANLDEGEPHGLPGTYMNGFCQRRPLPYAEGGYGYPETSETVINVTNGKIIRLLVDDETFDVRYGQMRKHERVLDLRAGVLRRNTEWVSPAGHDPRAAAALSSPLQSEYFFHRDARAVLVHSTRKSGLLMAAGMDHLVEGPPKTQTSGESGPDRGRVTVATEVQPGQVLRIVKFLAYGWSSRRSLTSVEGQVEAALAGARHTGWDNLLADQRAYLDDFWGRADVELEGDCRIATGRALRPVPRAVGGGALRAAGHRGQGAHRPRLRRACLLGFGGVRPARPDLHGAPCRPGRPALAAPDPRPGQGPGRGAGAQRGGLPLAHHPGRGVLGLLAGGDGGVPPGGRHRRRRSALPGATGDERFERDVGLELLVETARLGRSLGHHDADGNFPIDGVTGPDEYSAVADNNVYTNLMVQKNLLEAAAAARHPDQAKQFGVDTEEAASWRGAAKTMVVPFDEALCGHPQAEGFTSHGVWDFENTRDDQYPLLLHFPYFDLYRKQVVKQADLVLALYLRGDALSPEAKLANFNYYEAITVRDSSLSACVQAVMAAEVGHLELAHDYFGEAALTDLGDLQHNTRDGIHIASLAGAWLAAVAGFGGMRDHGGKLSFAPRLPNGSPGSRSAFVTGAPGSNSRCTGARPATRCWMATPSRSPTTAPRSE